MLDDLFGIHRSEKSIPSDPSSSPLAEALDGSTFRTNPFEPPNEVKLNDSPSHLDPHYGEHRLLIAIVTN